MMDLSGFPVYHELNITNPPSVPDFMLSAHGITAWKDPITGKVKLRYRTRKYCVCNMSSALKNYILLKHRLRIHIKAVSTSRS